MLSFSTLFVFRYDASYPIRGLILEIKTGNFLKVDSFGHISKCHHGSRPVPKAKLSEMYPSLVRRDFVFVFFFFFFYKFCFLKKCR